MLSPLSIADHIFANERGFFVVRNIKQCKGCNGPVCEFCNGCILEGECSCQNIQSFRSRLSISPKTEIIWGARYDKLQAQHAELLEAAIALQEALDYGIVTKVADAAELLRKAIANAEGE